MRAQRKTKGAAGRLLGTDGWGDGGSSFHCETRTALLPWVNTLSLTPPCWREPGAGVPAGLFAF